MAARVRIPLGLPMKKFALFTSLIALLACTDASSTVEVVPTGVAGTLSEVVCDSALEKKSVTASSTKESWQCKRDGKVVSFDVYVSEAAKNSASAEALSLLGTVGNSQNWASAPILCGETWTMGVADLETRDALIELIRNSGAAASTC